MSKRTFADMMVRLGADTRKFDQKFKKAQSSTKHLQSQLNVLKGALIGVFTVSGINNLLESYNTQAQAENTLLTALKGRKDLADQLISQASELQSKTLFGDEETIKAQALAASMGLTLDQIKKMIPAAQNLSTATGMTLEGAVKNLARTYGGLTGELGETIPALRNLTKEEMAAGGAIELVNELMGGQAEAASQAGTGGLKQLKNMIGDLGEVAGEAFYQVLQPGIAAMQEWIGKISSDIPKLKQQFENLIKILKVVGTYFLVSKGYALIWTNTLKGALTTTKAYGASLFALPARFNSVTKAMGTMTTAQRVMKTATITLAGATRTLWAAMKANPLGMVFLAFEAISAIIRRVKGDAEDLNTAFVNTMKNEFDSFINANDINGVKDRLENLKDLTKDQLVDLKQEIEQKVEDYNTTLQKLVDNSGFQQSVGEKMFGNPKLLEQYENYLSKIDSAIAGIGSSAKLALPDVKNLSSGFQEWIDSQGDIGSQLQAAFDDSIGQRENLLAGIWDRTENIWESMPEETFDEEPFLEKIDLAKEKMTQRMSDLASSLNSELSNGVASAFNILGSLIEDAFSGNLDSFDNWSRNILGKFGEFAAKMGSLMIAYGISMKAFQKAFADPTTAIVAGTALLAIGSAIKGLASRGVSGGSGAGGSVSGYSANNQNYGYSQPTLTTKVSGKDLLLVLNKQESFNARTS